MPSWWAPLRKSSLGTLIREHLPRETMNAMRNVAKSNGEIQELPMLSQEITDKLVQAIQLDTPKFEELTGLDLSRWDITLK